MTNPCTSNPATGDPHDAAISIGERFIGDISHERAREEDIGRIMEYLLRVEIFLIRNESRKYIMRVF